MNTPKPQRQDIHNSDVPVVCRSCEARHKGVCGALDPEQLTLLSKHTHKAAYKPGDPLVHSGDETAQYSNILKGVVKLTKLMADGRQQIVGLQFSPDFLGRPFQREASTDVEAANKVQLCSFPKSVLDDLIRNSPELEHRLHEQALKELDEAREMMLMLGRKTATEKVAGFLHLIGQHEDPEIDDGQDSRSFELPLKRADIADFLGLTIETVSRQLTKLRKLDVITIEQNTHIRIHSLERLRNIAAID